MTPPVKDEDVVSIGALILPLYIRRKLLLGLTIVGFAAGLAYYFLASDLYSAETTILPSSRGQSAMFGGASELALLAGVSLPGGADPTLFYREVMLSPQIIDAVLASPADSTMTIRQALEIGDAPTQRDKAVRKLRRRVSISRDSRSGVIEVKATASKPQFAEAIVNALVDRLDAFLRLRSRNSAGEQFDFLTQEIERAGQQLQLAEDDLEAFLNSNRNYGDSPSLQRELAALKREVLFREGVYVELRKQAEIQAYAEHQNVPMVETVGPASATFSPVQPRFSLSIAFGIVGLVLLGITWAYLAHYAVPLLRRELAGTAQEEAES